MLINLVLRKRVDGTALLLVRTGWHVVAAGVEGSQHPDFEVLGMLATPSVPGTPSAHRPMRPGPAMPAAFGSNGRRSSRSLRQARARWRLAKKPIKKIMGRLITDELILGVKSNRLCQRNRVKTKDNDLK